VLAISSNLKLTQRGCGGNLGLIRSSSCIHKTIVFGQLCLTLSSINGPKCPRVA
jgi:hypothetical protein